MISQEQNVGFATKNEAVKFLGVSMTVMDGMIRRGEIDIRRFGRTVRIPWAWLHDQAENKKAKTVAQ